MFFAGRSAHNMLYQSEANRMHTSRLWNIEGNKEVFSSLLDSTDVMQSVDFSSDGRFIATVAVEAQDITIWDASAGLKIKGSLKVNAEFFLTTLHCNVIFPVQPLNARRKSPPSR